MRKQKAEQIHTGEKFKAKAIYDKELYMYYDWYYNLLDDYSKLYIDSSHINLWEQLKTYIKKKIKKKKLKENVYSIKINANISCLSDKDFMNIVQSFREIAENFCDVYKIGAENLHISILSATPGCFNINFGFNINVKEFNVFKLSEVELDLTKTIVKFLTDKDIETYKKKPLQLLKDSITGYLTKKIPEDNEKLKYIDIKKSKSAKKIIYKTIKELPKLNSVTLEDKTIEASEIDVVV